MTLENVYEILSASGIPVTYHSWSDSDRERPGLPFMTYQVAYSSNFMADSRVYLPVNHIDISLLPGF